MSDGEGFVRRWSRRKTAQKHAPRTEVPPAAQEPPHEDGADAAQIPEADDGTPRQADEAADAEALPDIESLNESSDYSVFMRDSVPAEIRTAALRKLWRSSPIFNVRDGLNDYDGDFTDAAMAVKDGLATIYQAGKGYLKDAESEPAASAGEEHGVAEDAAQENTAAPTRQPESADAEAATEPEPTADPGSSDPVKSDRRA